VMWNFRERRKSEVQLRRITLPRTPVNKDKNQGRVLLGFAPASHRLPHIRDGAIDYDDLLLLAGSTVIAYFS
jgi:hypothetical protein